MEGTVKKKKEGVRDDNAQHAVFNKQVPFFVPSFSEAEERAVCDVLRSGWITTGTQALAFEKEFAAYVGAPYA